MIELNTPKELDGLLFTIKDIDFNATIECDNECFYRESKDYKCGWLKDYRKRGIHCPYFKIRCVRVVLNIKNTNKYPAGKLPPTEDAIILIDNKGHSYRYNLLCEDNTPQGFSNCGDNITIGTQADFILIYAPPRDGCFHVKMRILVWDGLERFIDFSVLPEKGELEGWIDSIKESMRSISTSTKVL